MPSRYSQGTGGWGASLGQLGFQALCVRTSSQCFRHRGEGLLQSHTVRSEPGNPGCGQLSLRCGGGARGQGQGDLDCRSVTRCPIPKTHPRKEE